jgi:hypothetical protein
MQLSQPEHVLVQSAKMDAMHDFYTRMLGMHVGPRVCFAAASSTREQGSKT